MSTYAGAVMVSLTWLCAFLGPVFIVYGMRGNNTLTNYEGVGCVLVSLPPTIIVVALVEVLNRGRGQQ